MVWRMHNAAMKTGARAGRALAVTLAVIAAVTLAGCGSNPISRAIGHAAECDAIRAVALAEPPALNQTKADSLKIATAYNVAGDVTLDPTFSELGADETKLADDPGAVASPASQHAFSMAQHDAAVYAWQTCSVTLPNP
jgi:hypothetical protein